MKKRKLLFLFIGFVFLLLIISMIFSYSFTHYTHKEKIRNLTLISNLENKLLRTQIEIEKIIRTPKKEKDERFELSIGELNDAYTQMNESLLHRVEISSNKKNGELLNLLVLVKDRFAEIEVPDEELLLNHESEELNIVGKEYEEKFDQLFDDIANLRAKYLEISNSDQDKLEVFQQVRLIATTFLFISLIIWLFIYINRLNETQARILESEAKYKNIFMNSPLGIFHYAYNGIITEFNDKFVEILGSSREKLIGINTLTQLNDDKLAAQIKQSLKTGTGYYEDLYESITSGKKVYVKLQLRGIRDEDDNIISGLGVVEDISEMKLVEQTLIESLEHNKTIVSAMPDLLFEITADGIFTDYNARDDNDLFLHPSEFIGKSINDIFNEKLAELTMEKISTTLVTGEMQVYEYPLQLNNAFQYFESRMVRGSNNSVLAIIRDITENKQTAELLRASRERYETFINETHEGIYRIEFSEPIKTDLDPRKQAELFYKYGYIAECNNAFIKMYGATAFVDIIGKSVEDFHDIENYPENFSQTVALMQNNFRAEDQKTVEKDNHGLVHHFSNNAFGIVENGYLVRMWGTQRDITELVEAEEEKKILYRAIEQSQVSIVITDLNGNIEYVNPKFESVTGYSFEEVFGKNPRFLKSGLSDGSLHSDLWESITKGQNWSGIFHNKKKNGELFFESATISPIADEDGNIRHYVAVKEDITELTKAQLELKNYKEYLEQVVEKRTEELNNKNIFLRTLIDTIPNPVFVINKEGKYTDVNKAFTEVFGIKFSEIIGESMQRIANKDVVAIDIMADKELLNKHGKMVYESSVIGKNNNEIPIMIYKASFGPEGGTPEGIAGLIVDITESKKTQDQMRKALEQERELNEMKTNFISLASHELRTPLTAIYSSTELLERFGKKWTEEKFNSHIARIKYSVDNLTDLMEDMLTLTRVDTGKIVFNPRAILLKSFVTENISTLELLKTENHKLDVKFSLNSDHYILDEKLIKYIIQNLLSNAIKYSPKGGTVSLNIWDDREHIFICVNDEGIGIQPEEIDNLFEPFYRGRNVANISGTGLGLSIVKEAVELHDGTLKVVSKLDKGTKFEIMLPIIK